MDRTEANFIYQTYVIDGHGATIDKIRLEKLLDEAYLHLSPSKKKIIDDLLQREPKIPRKNKKKLRSKWQPKPVSRHATIAISMVIERLSKTEIQALRWQGNNIVEMSTELYKVLETELQSKHWIPDNGINLYRSIPLTCKNCGKTSLWNNDSWCAHGCGSQFEEMQKEDPAIYAEHKKTGIRMRCLPVSSQDCNHLMIISDEKISAII